MQEVQCFFSYNVCRTYAVGAFLCQKLRLLITVPRVQILARLLFSRTAFNCVSPKLVCENYLFYAFKAQIEFIIHLKWIYAKHNKYVGWHPISLPGFGKVATWQVGRRGQKYERIRKEN